MKKLVFLFPLLAFLLAGCSSSQNLIKGSLAEITREYFFGQNTLFSVSISVGQREEPYCIDGHAQKLVDFALVVLQDRDGGNGLNAQVDLSIDGKTQQLLLEYNPLSRCYMADLGCKLDSGSAISLEYEGRSIDINQISSSFAVNADQAIDIAANTFKSLLKKHKLSTGLDGECYLKVFGQKQDDGHLFWCFTFVTTSQKNYNLIIDVQTGNVVASDNC